MFSRKKEKLEKISSCSWPTTWVYVVRTYPQSGRCSTEVVVISYCLKFLLCQDHFLKLTMITCSQILDCLRFSHLKIVTF